MAPLLKKIQMLLKSNLTLYYCTLFLSLGSFIIIVNNNLKFPDVNDFKGLSQICLLMDDNIKYCVNTNWGFAHPLVQYLLTKVTGNLLVSQRIISGIFVLLALLLSKKIMKSIFPIKSKISQLFILYFFIMTPWYISAIISVHLDIIAVTFILLGIVLLNTSKAISFFWVGMIVSISYWFRYHFLMYVILYPAVVYLFNFGNNRRAKTAFCGAGVFVGLLIPHILCFFSYGAISIINQKEILMLMAGIYDSYSFEYVKRIPGILSSHLFGEVTLARLTMRFVLAFKDARVILLMVFYAIFIREQCVELSQNAKKEKVANSNIPFRLMVLITYSLVSVLPFVFIRGSTSRIWSALFIVSLPICTYIVFTFKRPYYYIMMLLFVVSSLWESYSLLNRLNSKNKYFEDMSCAIESTIPLNELKVNFNKILMVAEYYNKYNKYLMFHSAVIGGWPVYFKPLIERFGRIDLYNLFESKAYQNFNYIILDKRIFPVSYLPVMPNGVNVLPEFTMLLETERLMIIKINYSLEAAQ